MDPEFRLWATERTTWCNQEVAGIFHRRSAIARLFGPTWRRSGEELRVDVQLKPEPDNPHDANAIAVYALGVQIGYLPAEIARGWVKVIRRITYSGCTATTDGRIYMYETTDWEDPRRPAVNRVNAEVRLPDVRSDAIPLNNPPERIYTLLPRSGIVQVTKEAGYFDTLVDFVPRSGHGLLYATLHRDVVQTARTTKPVVAVHLDGNKIGELTLQMSSRFLPLIDHLEQRGIVTTCWADITGSSVAARVRIDAVKAHEASDQVLDGPPITVPALLPEFVTDWWSAITAERPMNARHQRSRR